MMFTNGRKSLETSFYRLCWQFITCCGIFQELSKQSATDTVSSSASGPTSTDENSEFVPSRISVQQNGGREAVPSRRAMSAPQWTVATPVNEPIALGKEDIEVLSDPL